MRRLRLKPRRKNARIFFFLIVRVSAFVRVLQAPNSVGNDSAHHLVPNTGLVRACVLFPRNFVIVCCAERPLRLFCRLPGTSSALSCAVSSAVLVWYRLLFLCTVVYCYRAVTSAVSFSIVLFLLARRLVADAVSSALLLSVSPFPIFVLHQIDRFSATRTFLQAIVLVQNLLTP